jgi:hypothetical protein
LSPEAISIVLLGPGVNNVTTTNIKSPQNQSVDNLHLSQLTTKRTVPSALRHDPASLPDRSAVWQCVDWLPGKQKRDYNARCVKASQLASRSMEEMSHVGRA